MPPNNPFEQQPSGIDYLNQIAAPAPPTGFDKKTKIILVICGIIGILSLVMIASLAGRDSSGPSPLSLVARLQKLQTLTTKYTPKLKDSNLQAANSSLNAILTTANTSIATPLAAYGIDAEKQAKEITAMDPTTEIEKTLDDAYLNANLDSTYTLEMTLQIEETILMMQRLQRGTRVQSMKDFLTKTISDFENIKKQLSAVS